MQQWCFPSPKHNIIVQFRVSTLDVGVPEEAEQIVQLAESMGPVGGVFHLAMYLADKLITNQVGRRNMDQTFFAVTKTCMQTPSTSEISLVMFERDQSSKADCNVMYCLTTLLSCPRLIMQVTWWCHFNTCLKMTELADWRELEQGDACQGQGCMEHALRNSSLQGDWPLCDVVILCGQCWKWRLAQVILSISYTPISTFGSCVSYSRFSKLFCKLLNCWCQSSIFPSPSY